MSSRAGTTQSNSPVSVPPDEAPRPGEFPEGCPPPCARIMAAPNRDEAPRLDGRERGVLDENPAAEFLSLFRRDVEHALDSTALRNRDLDEANGTKPVLGNLVQVRLQVDSRRWARTGPERRVGGLEGSSDAARAAHRHRGGRNQDGIANGDATHGAADGATIAPRRPDPTGYRLAQLCAPSESDRNRSSYVWSRRLRAPEPRLAEMRECDTGGHTSSAAATACYLSIS